MQANYENHQNVAAIHISQISAYPLRAAVAHGPESSLASMPVRQGCLVRLEDRDGAHGWGEIWCNFPPHGAESRAHLVRDVIAPCLTKRAFTDWQDVRPWLEKQLLRMMIHTGEAGAFAQCFAGIDMAMADLCARRAGLGMAHFLGAAYLSPIRVYASTPSSGPLAAQCEAIKAAGHTAIKLKIGYDPAKDILAVKTARAVMGSEFSIMVDANQAWDSTTAKAQIAALEPLSIDFIEEPLLAEESLDTWQALAQYSPIALAAGENISSPQRFRQHVDNQSLKIVQPDLAKWGGVSGAMDVGRYARAHGANCYMHFMGTGLGLAASLLTLAAIGGQGRVELDVNENPLRTELGDIDLAVRDGCLVAPVGVGFGFSPDPAQLKRFSV